jgi:hypothetical protein
MCENYDEYMKELRAMLENAPDDRLIYYWRSDIAGLLAPVVQVMDLLTGKNPSEVSEVLDQEIINSLRVNGEKAFAEIDFIVQYVERLQQEKHLKD